MATATNDKPHAVLVPFPAQGHVTPMMKLAKVLHREGFHVTFVNTEYNQRRLVRSRGPGAVAGLPGFRFATIPDGIPTSHADADAGPAVPLLLHHDHLPPPPEEPAPRPQRRRPGGAAGELRRGRRRHELLRGRRRGARRALRALLDCQRLRLHGLPQLPLPPRRGPHPSQRRRASEQRAPGHAGDAGARDEQAHAPPGLLVLRPHDGPRRHPLQFLLHEVEQADRAAAVVLNTFDELEQTALDAMRAVLPVPVYTIGPLHFLTEQLVSEGDLAGIRSSLWREDRSCLEWLHGREPRSVVYVNYGSVTTMSKQELVEFAWGLADCGHDFLWVVRNDLVKGDAAVLPPEFLEATRGRCLLASWCEQEAVMRHEAVGAFLTHCGWNSMVEGLGAGVPMLCWPFFAEQQTNSRYACAEWGVGVEVGNDVRREAVAARIREVMGGGEAGREMRRRAAEWKEAASRSTAQPDGRSLANLESLLKDVLKWPAITNN